MSKLLTDEQVSLALSELDGWDRDGDSIVRTAELSSFPAAIDAVRAVAELAEARDHHPDIDIRWRTLTFRCSTHSEGGLTGKDVELAREINGVLAR
jgi:4a-hydroxytetrahydrobiopterin dehydratase